MSQRAQIVDELKRVLREQAITYAAVAKKLSLSEASVKRLFSSADFTLERLDRICDLAGIALSDVIERMHERASATNKLTVEQEREIVADPKLFLVTWLVLNRWQYDDMIKAYKLTDREALRCLLKLDRLKVIELQPRNKARLLVSRHFTWRPGGPVQNYIHQKMLREFIGDRFIDAQDEFFFHGGVVSDSALAQIKQQLQSCARSCVEIMDRDRMVPTKKRSGAALVLALRPWAYSGFAEYLRG
jgi:DNA-binding Xre family transcriptional regulator